MKAQREEFLQASQKNSDWVAAAVQRFKEFTPEAQQKQSQAIFEKLGKFSDFTKQTDERVAKLTNDIVYVRKQNLTMDSQLEHICQHLGAKAAGSGGGGSFASATAEKKDSGPYVSPHKRGLRNFSSGIDDTSHHDEEEEEDSLIRLNLESGRTVLFTDKGSGTPISGVEAPTAAVADLPPSGADLLEQIKQIIRTEIGSPSANLQYRNPFPDHIANSEWTRGYKPIKFTSFSGEGSEDAATHISRF